jgi:hypothetical protein
MVVLRKNNPPPPQVAEAFSQSSLNISGLTPKYPSNQILFAKDKFPNGIILPPVIVYKAQFINVSYAFCTQEWFNLARDDIMSWRRTPPLDSFLVGWSIRHSPEYGNCTDFLNGKPSTFSAAHPRKPKLYK